MESDFVKQMADGMMLGAQSGVALLNAEVGTTFQAVSGRIPHQQAQLEAVDPGAGHTYAQYMRRSMDAMGIDYQVVFPNRWITERIIPDEPRLLSLIYLPFQSPELCVEIVEKYANVPGVIGFPSAACVIIRSIIRRA